MGNDAAANWTAKHHFTVIEVKLPMSHEDKAFEKMTMSKQQSKRTNKTKQKKRHHLMRRDSDINM